MTVGRTLQILAALLVLVQPALTQKRATRPLPSDEVVRNLQHNYEGIQDYTVSLLVSVNLEKLKVAPMHITMYFKQPDKIHFDSRGFAMLPKQAVGLNFARLQDRFSTVGNADPDTVGAKHCLRITLLPRDDKTKLRRLIMDVDSSRWTPERIRIPLLDGREMTVNITSEQIGNRWLPAAMVARFAVAQGDSAAPNLMEELAPNRQPPQVHEGTVSITYSDYKLNTGLGDEMFNEDDRSQQTDHRP